MTGLAGAGAAGAAAETTFAQAVSAAAERAVGTLERAQGLSLDALQGEADTREVVDAVMNAEQTLQASIAIRDKIVTAYLEISRMQI
ncbi:flagellar hook-basal body complex protein FliE [Aquamicrobium sp. LC103]|uniref:flagellar hook-basal body complex protein FliE n=1 Tax=Aquamicrobium sp. LC103 TaxID=1120658 RepID=UPI0032B1DE7A